VLYIKSFLIALWLILCSAFGLIYSIIRWGNPNIDRDFGRAFAWGVLKILGIRVDVEGKQYLEASQPCIYVINHQSGLDMATLGNIYPKRTVIIGKKELLWIPFFGIFYVAAGNIIIDRQKTVKAVAGLNQAVEAIRNRKVSIWIFPEGTRNKTGESILPFKRGAFHMALQAQVPVVPIVCGPLNDLVSWKEKRMKSGIIRVKVLPPVNPGLYRENEVDKMTNDVRAQMMEAFHGLSS
jgi:1-acyl-sn-glycerol-3-phosphate acyltransferase